MPSKRLGWFIFGGLALATAGWWVWQSLQPPNAKAMSQRLLRCFQAGDMACVRRLTTREERQALRLTDAQYERFLREWALPRYRGEVEWDQVTVISDGKSGWQEFEYPMVQQDGQRLISVTIAETDEGVRAIAFASGLINGELARTPTVRTTPEANKRRRWAAQLRAIAPELAKYGVTTTYSGPGMPVRGILEFADALDRRAERDELEKRR